MSETDVWAQKNSPPDHCSGVGDSTSSGQISDPIGHAVTVSSVVKQAGLAISDSGFVLATLSDLDARRVIVRKSVCR